MENTRRGWSPPDPKQLPEIRARLAEATITPDAHMKMRTMVSYGKATALPYFPHARGERFESLAAAALCRSEYARLWQAKPYFVNDDMTSLAVALGTKPPKTPVKPGRAPSPYGFMVFAEPIGGYTQSMADVLAGSDFTDPADISVTTPIVAVAWSPFDPARVEGLADDSVDGVARWAYQDLEGIHAIPPEHPGGVWITFYTPSESPFSSLDPSTMTCRDPDGFPITAGNLASLDKSRTSLLNWDNEMIVTTGAEWPDPPAPDTSQQWAQVVYRAWQCMTQSGKRSIAEGELLARDRAARKRDARAGGRMAEADNDVRVVRLHPKHRPSPAAAEQDAAESTGRRAPTWSCRWPVLPHVRKQCFNPRGHAAGDCEHDEIVIPFHVKGPDDKPLKASGTVSLWDRMPDGWEGLDGEE